MESRIKKIGVFVFWMVLKNILKLIVLLFEKLWY